MSQDPGEIPLNRNYKDLFDKVSFFFLSFVFFFREKIFTLLFDLTSVQLLCY